MSNPNVDILFHPTDRIIPQRQSIDVNIEKIIHVSKETNTILEVDSSPGRLDLRDEYIKLAVENGCKLTIDSDAHDKSHLHFLKFGISQEEDGQKGKTLLIHCLWKSFLNPLLKSCQIVRYFFICLTMFTKHSLSQ